MKQIIILSLTLCMTPIFSQSEGQNFCSEFESDHYFPLHIHKKKLTWYDLSYFESKTSVKVLNDKEYISFAQEWNSGEIDYLYLREENGIIYQQKSIQMFHIPLKQT